MATEQDIDINTGWEREQRIQATRTPPQGPTLPGYDWLLHQDTWWYPYRRPAVRVAEMDKPWRFNTAQFLERKARDLHATVGMRYMHNAPDDVWASWESENPVKWLRELPLLHALNRGLPRPGTSKFRSLAERASHWHTCPYRLAPEKRPRGPHDSNPACVCIRNGFKVVGASNDPATRHLPDVTDISGNDLWDMINGRVPDRVWERIDAHGRKMS